LGIPSVAAAQIAVEALDAYINAYYRSTKNHRSGLSVEAHLDAAESISPFLSALFAIHERVRPFNKFLGWELEKFPLGDDVWSAAKLLPRLQAITATGTWLRSKASGDAERLARSHEQGYVVDGWEPDVGQLRGA
jgi:hypothetical protein